jgi:preprotein translocase subunit SecA
LIYKFESFELFKQMVSEINREVIAFLFKGDIPRQQEGEVREAKPQPKQDFSKMQARKPELAGAMASAGGRPEMETPQKLQPVHSGPRVGRNDPCPCGSGKKFKNCHGVEV